MEEEVLVGGGKTPSPFQAVFEMNGQALLFVPS